MNITTCGKKTHLHRSIQC